MSLKTTLDRWPSAESIRAAAIVSEDGLLIHDALATGMDAEAVAALAVTLLRTGLQFGQAALGGDVGSLVVELKHGAAILAGLDSRHTLVVLAKPNRDLGQLLFDIRREKTSLSRAV